MKKFDIPFKYRSSIISKIKEIRKISDPRKKDFSPTKLNFGPLEIIIARHFGFCYGVENAIEIAYKTIEENPDKRIFLLSEMIHNPGVNEDLLERGVKFLMDTSGNELINWNKLTTDDVVIIPAFGTTLEIENKLKEIGINPYRYNTTCPFVEKVWNKADQLGGEEYTIVIHGKHIHEETRATFSHSVNAGKSIIVRDIKEAEILSDFILNTISVDEFEKTFKNKYSSDFNPENDLLKVGVVNQTTMLASETEAIADLLKTTMTKKYGEEKIKDHFADTRDTLCYATNDNQNATFELLKEDADFAIIVGGYNSSNTTHLVELLEEKFKTYFISSSDKIINENEISHFNIHSKKEVNDNSFINKNENYKIIITSGASCPDAVVDEVITKIVSFFENTTQIDDVLKTLTIDG